MNADELEEQWRTARAIDLALFQITSSTGELRETLLEVTDEMEDLAAAYLRQGVVPPKYAGGATHVAVCTVARLQYLVSWNFRHLVNVQREAGFNAVNLLQGYPPIRIVNPLELIHGNQDQNL